MMNFSANKKPMKAPPKLSQSNFGKNKKKEEESKDELEKEEKPKVESKDEPEKEEEKPKDGPKEEAVEEKKPSSDPADDIPIKPLGQAKDPFADAYPSGQGPPADTKDELLMDF